MVFLSVQMLVARYVWQVLQQLPCWQEQEHDRLQRHTDPIYVQHTIDRIKFFVPRCLLVVALLLTVLTAAIPPCSSATNAHCTHIETFRVCRREGGPRSALSHTDGDTVLKLSLRISVCVDEFIWTCVSTFICSKEKKLNNWQRESTFDYLAYHGVRNSPRSSVCYCLSQCFMVSYYLLRASWIWMVGSLSVRMFEQG